MFDAVPIRVWIVIALAAYAVAPAKYVLRHINHSPSRRDITQPPQDLAWRSTGQLIRSLALLAFLALAGAFIFTPWAEQLARSPRFVPGLLAALGLWVLFLVVQGLVTGRTEPLIKGLYTTYERATQPARYWASMVWNVAMGGICFLAAYQMDREASLQTYADDCVRAADAGFPDRQLSACSNWIATQPHDSEPYFERGLVHLEIGALDRAASDFSKAHKIDPQDPWPIANRGLVLAWKNDRVGAERDFAVVRSKDPTNPVMLRGESILLSNAGDLHGAVAKLTESMKRDPENLWALRTRSELYWRLGDHDESIADDRRWIQLKQNTQSPNRN